MDVLKYVQFFLSQSLCPRKVKGPTASHGSRWNASPGRPGFPSLAAGPGWARRPADARRAGPTSAGIRAWCMWPGARPSRCPPRRCSDRRCTRPSSPLARQGWPPSPRSSSGLQGRNRLYWRVARAHKRAADLTGDSALPHSLVRSLSGRTAWKLPFQPGNCSHFFPEMQAMLLESFLWVTILWCSPIDCSVLGPNLQSLVWVNSKSSKKSLINWGFQRTRLVRGEQKQANCSKQTKLSVTATPLRAGFRGQWMEQPPGGLQKSWLPVPPPGPLTPRFGLGPWNPLGQQVLGDAVAGLGPHFEKPPSLAGTEGPLSVAFLENQGPFNSQSTPRTSFSTNRGAMCILLHVKSRTQRYGYWGDFQCELFPVEQMVLCYGSHPQLRGEQLCRLQTFLNEDLGPHCSLKRHPDPEFQALSSHPLLLKSLCAHTKAHWMPLFKSSKKNTAKLKKVNYSTKTPG